MYSRYYNKNFLAKNIAGNANNILRVMAIPMFLCGSETNDMHLVTRKGVYPYENTDSWQILDERELPPKERFHSKLNDSDISDEDYSLAN